MAQKSSWTLRRKKPFFLPGQRPALLFAHRAKGFWREAKFSAIARVAPVRSRSREVDVRKTKTKRESSALKNTGSP